MRGDGRNAQPLSAPHASGANGGQAIGQTPQGVSPATGSRCGSCGGPSNGEELCPACQQAFSAMLRKAASAPAAAIPAPAVPAAPGPAAGAPAQASTAPANQPGATRVDQDLWAQLMGTPAPPPMDSFDLPPAPVPPLVTAPPPPPLPPPPLPPGHTGPSEAAIRAAQIAAAQAAAIKLEPIKLERPKSASTSAAAPAAAAKLHTAPERLAREMPVPRPAQPSVASKPSSLVALLPSTTDRIGAGLALLCVLGMGAGAAWFHFRDDTAPMTVLADVVEPEKTDASPAASPEPESVQTPTSRAPGKPAAPVAAPAAPRKTAEAPVNLPARAKTPAAGPFFQPSEVNEAPRVMRRIEPRVPRALRGRKLDEIVVVRALVSKDGQPSRVSLLRRSRAGVALDDAVVAAVNQWTFTPALKEGEPVSSWFNFAVPVSRPD